MVFRLIRWANDNLVSSAAVITAILLLMSGIAMITHLIGVHTVLGAFIAGVLVGESPILTRQTDERLRGLISSLFLPVFFGLAGLSADLTVLKDPSVLGLTAALVLIASIGKFGGAFVGGALGGLTRQESYALASGMNARGSTEVIIATIGLSMGVLSQTMFSMIVTMAILTTWRCRRCCAARWRGCRSAGTRRSGWSARNMSSAASSNARKILVPVSGSNVSRRGAEVAIALARLSSEPLQVVYVSTTRDKGARRTSPSMSLAHEEAILKDIAATAARYDINVTTRLRANTAPEVAILQEIASSRADLVVIGVDRIQGDSLNFGSIAAAVLGKSKASVLLVSDGDVRPKT